MGWAVAACLGLIAGGILLRQWRVVVSVSQGLDRLALGQKPKLVRAFPFGPVGRLAREFNAATIEIRAQASRRERDHSQLLVVLGAMAEAVVAVDPRRRLLFANASAHQLFGLDASSVGRLVAELIRVPQVQEAVDATLGLESPATHQAELVIPGRDAAGRAVRYLSARGSPLPGHPAPGVVLVFHDVTELRRLESMRQDFVANASHELKTPLASIKAYAETLLDWAIHDESVNIRFLERIDEQANRLDQLIQDLLSLARLESGQGAFEHRPIVLASALEPCVESHRDRAAAKSLRLLFNARNFPRETTVFADEEALHQIFNNLIDNAIKYTPEGGRVSVSCLLDGDMACVEVEDTGIGIPRDELTRIFERFYRVDKTRSRELGGTGLGLSIVKHVVQSIGGQIDVTSRVGSGSRFTVLLPRATEGQGGVERENQEARQTGVWTHPDPAATRASQD